MATIQRPGLPSFWCTHIAKVLCGDQPCLLAPFLSGHYLLEKRVRDDGSSLAIWKANHTELLFKTVGMYRESGWKCDVERFWRVTGQAAIISGKADMVVQKPAQRPLIIDVKSGQPRDSDVMQVLVEMVMIPLAWKTNMTFAGQVIYPTHEVNVAPQAAVELKPKLFAMLKRLGLMGQRPAASPSESACRFCDVSDLDCPDRFVAKDEPEATTADF